MYHAVLDGGEAGFDLIVNLFGNSVGGKEGQAAVGGDFYINVEAVAELAGAQQIQPQHALLGLNDLRHGLFHLWGCGLVHQLLDSAHKDVVGGFQDKHADHQAGQGVQCREA